MCSIVCGSSFARVCASFSSAEGGGGESPLCWPKPITSGENLRLCKAVGASGEGAFPAAGGACRYHTSETKNTATRLATRAALESVTHELITHVLRQPVLTRFNHWKQQIHKMLPWRGCIDLRPGMVWNTAGRMMSPKVKRPCLKTKIARGA